MSTLSHAFDRLLPLIESDLRQILDPPPGSPPEFYRMLHYHMGWMDADGQAVDVHGGKRIRPVLALLACESVCDDFGLARPSACAVELIHNFSLLHDDIEDRSPERRGRPTAWRVWGEPQAINVGDGLYTIVHMTIPRLSAAGTSPQLILDLMAVLDETSLVLTYGQYLDMAFETREEVRVDEYLDMISKKTAALLSSSAQMGAMSGGADEERQKNMADFGYNLGMAFQVLDDVLDIWGDPSETGKKAAVDIYQRKKSLPVLYGLARSEELSSTYRQPDEFDDKTVKRIVKLLDKAGAQEYARNLAKEYSDETIACLEAASPAGEAGEALFEVIEMLLNRKR